MCHRKINKELACELTSGKPANCELTYISSVGNYCIPHVSLVSIQCGCAPCTVNRYLIHCVRRKTLMSDLSTPVKEAIAVLMAPFSIGDPLELPAKPKEKLLKSDYWLLLHGFWASSREQSGRTWEEKKRLATYSKELVDYASRCAGCKKKFTSAQVYLIPANHDHYHYAQLCHKCREDATFIRECGWCDQPFIVANESYFDPDDGHLICSGCSGALHICHRCGRFSENENCTNCDVDRGLYRYNYKPRFTFYSSDKEVRDYRTLFTGIELEMGTTTGALVHDAAAVVNREEGMYAVHDGSITRQGILTTGVELITMPFTRHYWYETLREQLDTTLQVLKSKHDMQAYKHQTCGMHIHLSRSSFTQARLYKFLYLLIKNSSWACEVGQRKEDDWMERYCSFSKEGKTRTAIIAKARGADIHQLFDPEDGRVRYDPHDKYVAINTNGSRSVEIRIFKGTLNMAAIQKNLECMWAMFDWSLIVSNDELNLLSFLDFVDQNRKEYMALFDFLCASKQYPKMKTNNLKQFRGD